MSRELFRTTFINRDTRLLKVYITCQYCIASLFLGMFLVLSGIMITSYVENYRIEEGLTKEQIEEKTSNSQLFGSIILISGCLLLIMAIILFFVSAILFLRTTTSPPEDNWINFIENQRQTTSPEEVILSESVGNVTEFDGIDERVDNLFEGDSDNTTRDKRREPQTN